MYPNSFPLSFQQIQSVWALMHKPKHSRKAKEVILFCPMALINHYTLITVRYFLSPTLPSPQNSSIIQSPASLAQPFQGLRDNANSLCTNQTPHFCPQTCSSGSFCISADGNSTLPVVQAKILHCITLKFYLKTNFILIPPSYPFYPGVSHSPYITATAI